MTGYAINPSTQEFEVSLIHISEYRPGGRLHSKALSQTNKGRAKVWLSGTLTCFPPTKINKSKLESAFGLPIKEQLSKRQVEDRMGKVCV